MLFTRLELCEEIRELASKHVQEIGRYISIKMQIEDASINRLAACLESISQFCCYPPELVSYDLYMRACDYYDEFVQFLQSMNQSIDADFKESLLGRLWTQVTNWRQAAARRFQLTTHEVWDCINPVCPDSLLCLSDGQYEARWWKPVPMMDVEILKRTESVQVLGDAYEPQELPGGLAVRFAISPATT